MLSPSKTTPVCTRTIVLREGVGHPARLAVLAVSSLMHAFGHAALALLGGAVVLALGNMSVGTPRSTFLGTHGAVTLAIAAIAASGLRLLGSTCGAYASARMAGDVSTALRARVLKGLFAVHRLRHPRQADHGSACGERPDADSRPGRHARAVSALTLRIREVTSALESSVAAVRAALQLVLLAAVVVVVAPRLFVVAMIVLAPFGWALGRARKWLRGAQREEIEQAESLLEAADEAVRHGELWQSFGAERKIQRVLGRLGSEARDRTARLEAWSTAQTGANELLGIVAVALGLWALSTFASAEASRFAPFAVPFFLAYRPLRDLAEARLAMGRAGEAARELDVVLAHADEDANEDGEPHVREWPLADLVISDLRHAQGQWSPLSLRVTPGSIVALVGPTGCGKTTLLRVLLGLDAQDGGHVFYGTASLDGRAPGPNARPFAWAPQDAPVLAATLDENVQLAAAANSHEADRDEVRALLASLGATSLLALGEARLGTGHRPLSGGERQWLSIARALATEQPVLLLDEPTSGLDPSSERAVLDALARLRGTRTILIVTHREAPCAIADTVIRLGDPPLAPARRQPPTSVERHRN